MKTERRHCRLCGALVLHRGYEDLFSADLAWYPAERHRAPCGVTCLLGSLPQGMVAESFRHGFEDSCPRCGPVSVRERAAPSSRVIKAAAPSYVEYLKAEGCI